MDLKENKSLIVIGAIIAAILFYRYSQTFAISEFTGYPYSQSYTYNGLPISVYSNTPFNSTFFKDYTDNNGVEYTTRHLENKFDEAYIKTEVTSEHYYVADFGRAWMQDYPNFFNSIVIDRQFTMRDIDRIIIDFEGSASFNPSSSCQAQTDSNVKIYLSNEERDVLLYANVYNTQSQTPIAKRLVIYQNQGIYLKDINSEVSILNVTAEEEFKIVVFTRTNMNFQACSQTVTSYQKFVITNIEFVAKNITVYRLSNNQCIPMSIPSTTRLTNDYDTLALCQAQIQNGNNQTQNNQTIVYIYKNQTVNQTVYVNKEVKVNPTLFQKYGTSIFIALILGAVIIYLIYRRKR